jgi:hypothetical protein
VPEFLAGMPPLPSGRPTPEPERRSRVRQCPQRLTLVPIGDDPRGAPVRAILDNLSEQGIGLVFLRPVESGSTFIVQLHGRQPGSYLTCQAQVVHASPLPDGMWLVGCTLAPKLSGSGVRRALRHLRAES